MSQVLSLELYNYLNRKCCSTPPIVLSFVNTSGLNPDFCDGGELNFDNFSTIDLSPYGGGVVNVFSKQDIIDAFATLGIIITIDGCTALVIPSTYSGIETTIEVGGDITPPIPMAWDDIIFNTDNGLSVSSEIWTGDIDGINTWETNYGQSVNKYLLSGQDGAIRVLRETSAPASEEWIIGIKSTNTPDWYHTYEFGMYITTGGGVYSISYGGPSSVGYTLSDGEYVAIFREAGIYSIKTSFNGNTWTEIFSFGSGFTGDMYASANIFYNDHHDSNLKGHMYYPQVHNFTNFPPLSGNVVFVGDSITHGIAASPLSNRWTTLFSLAKGVTEVNMGIDGQVIQNGTGCTTVFDKTTIPTYSGSYSQLIIALGLNDIGQNNGSMDVPTFTTVYEDIIDYAVATKGWPTSKISLLTPYYVLTHAGWTGSCGVTIAANQIRHESYVNAVISIASTKSVNLIDIYQIMKDAGLDSTYYNVDEIHPNNAGHSFIASEIGNYF